MIKRAKPEPEFREHLIAHKAQNLASAYNQDLKNREFFFQEWYKVEFFLCIDYVVVDKSDNKVIQLEKDFAEEKVKKDAIIESQAFDNCFYNLIFLLLLVMVKKMGYIREKLKIKGNKGTEEMDVLFDSGSKRTFIIKEQAEKICDIQYYDEFKPITLADGITEIKDVGYCAFETTVDGKSIEDLMDVLEVPKTEKNADMYIGAPTLQKFKLKLRFSNDEGGDYVDTSEYDSASYLF
jgi:hypothetical protein